MVSNYGGWPQPGSWMREPWRADSVNITISLRFTSEDTRYNFWVCVAYLSLNALSIFHISLFIFRAKILIHPQMCLFYLFVVSVFFRKSLQLWFLQLSILYLLSGDYCTVWVIGMAIWGQSSLLRMAPNLQLRGTEWGEESIFNSKMS